MRDACFYDLAVGVESRSSRKRNGRQRERLWRLGQLRAACRKWRIPVMVLSPESDTEQSKEDKEDE